jgi:hypothetical protein
MFGAKLTRLPTPVLCRRILSSTLTPSAGWLMEKAMV